MSTILSHEQRQQASAASQALFDNANALLTRIERQSGTPDRHEDARLKDITARAKRLARKAQGGIDNPLQERSTLYKAIYCLAAAQGNALEAAKYAERFQLDATTALIIRAAASGADSTTTAWAGELVVAALGEFIPLLRGRSALFALASPIPTTGSVRYPRTATGSASGFVAEGAAIPVKANTLDNVLLVALKAAGIVVGSRELMQRADAFSESFFIGTLADDLALGVDQVFLSTAAATAAAPAGIFHDSNAAAATLAASGGDAAACASDLRALLTVASKFTAPRLLIHPSAVATALALAGSNDYAIIQALATGRIGRRVEVIEADNIVTDTVGIIDADGLLVTGGEGLEIDVSTSATLHMDTAPNDDILAESTDGASMFQREMVATAVKMPIGWRSKSIEHVRFITGATWV